MFTAPYSPQNNGIAERVNRTIVETARTLIHNANMDQSYWADAVQLAAYIRNHLPTTANQYISAYEKMYKKKRNISYIRIFGCIAWARKPLIATKMDERAVKCRLLGYDSGARACKLENLLTGMVITSRNVKFDEEQLAQIQSVNIKVTKVFDLNQIPIARVSYQKYTTRI